MYLYLYVSIYIYVYMYARHGRLLLDLLVRARFRTKRGQLQRFSGRLPESHGQTLVSTVLCVQYALGSNTGGFAMTSRYAPSFPHTLLPTLAPTAGAPRA